MPRKLKSLTWTDSEGNIIVKKKMGPVAKGPKKGSKKGSLPKGKPMKKNGMPY